MNFNNLIDVVCYFKDIKIICVLCISINIYRLLQDMSIRLI